MDSKKTIRNWIKSQMSRLNKTPKYNPVAPANPSLFINLAGADKPLNKRVFIPEIGHVYLTSKCSTNELKAQGIHAIYIEREVSDHAVSN